MTEASLAFNTAGMGQQAREAQQKRAQPPKKLLQWRQGCCGGVNVAGTERCFQQGAVWVCKCVKVPVQNLRLLHTFVSQVLLERLHLSTEKNKWDNFASLLITSHPTYFGPPFCPISGDTVQSRLNTCLNEVRRKHSIPQELPSTAGGGTGNSWEDHQDITPYDQVVMKIDTDIKLRDQADKADARRAKQVQNNCMHFEGSGVLPGVVVGSGVCEGEDGLQDTSMEVNGSDEEEDGAPAAGEIDTRRVIPPGRRKRAAAAAFETAQQAEWKAMCESIKGTPEEIATRQAEKAAEAEERREERDERAAERAAAVEREERAARSQDAATQVLLAMLKQMAEGRYSAGNGNL
jgi:hypothetical protein